MILILDLRAKLFDIKEQEAHEIVRRCPHTVITNSCKLNIFQIGLLNEVFIK